MCLLSLQDYNMTIEALDFFLDACDDLSSEEERQFATLRQWVLLQKSKVEANV